LEFDPPIASRETDELIEIANYIEKWDAKAVEQAKKELEIRGITKEEQNEKVSLWDAIAKEEWKLELEERKVESYSLFSLIWMAIRWPFTMLWDWHLKEDGYFRMHKQRRIAIISGIFFFLALLIWANLNSDNLNSKWQKEVDSQDISEWEEEFYSDTDLNQQLLDKAVNEAKNNQKQNIRTVLIINSDTSKIEQLKMVEASSLINISYTDDFDPSYILIITIDTK